MRLDAIVSCAFLLWAGSAVSATDTAATLSPTAAAAPASATAQAVTPTPEEDVEDDAQAVTATAKLDLSKAETRLLAKISENVTLSQGSILFNLEDNTPADKPGIAVDEVEVAGLYAELGRRAVAEDREASQALSMAMLRGDPRAKDAKNRAFEDRLAESLIKRISNGDQGAKDELMTQAKAGNEKARLYLGLDRAAEAGLAQPVSGSSAAGAPAALSLPAATATKAPAY